MQYTETAPSPHLKSFIKCFWSLKQERSAHTTPAETVVPDGRIEVIFNLAERFQRIHKDLSVETQPASIVTGQICSSILIKPTGIVDLFGIRFHRIGAYPFFDLPMDELTDRIESLDSVFGKAAKDLEDQINLAKDLRCRVAVIETWLTKRLCAIRDIDRSLKIASDKILQEKGAARISKIATEIGIGERRLERKFRQKTGLSPKMFSRIVRFQNLLKSLQDNVKPELLDTALSFGYFDQPHMIREFREFSGKSPLAFLEDANRMNEVFSSAE